MNILIVDDDLGSRELLAGICRAVEGHQVTVAETGEDAWALLDDPKRWFEVVFLDVSLPKLTGIQLLQRLRESPIHRTIEVVMCTASNDRATITQAISLGAKHYIVKPGTAKVINEKLKVIDDARLANAQTRPPRGGSRPATGDVRRPS